MHKERRKTKDGKTMSEHNPLLDKMFENIPSKPIHIEEIHTFMPGTWYVFKCKCHKWSVQEIRQTIQKAHFKCKFCDKTAKIKRKDTWGIALEYKGPFANPRDATAACQAANGGRE